MVLSVLVTWVLLMVLAVTAAELARRHHRAAARHAWRHGQRGARFARRHTGRGARWLTARAADRWQHRQHRPLMFTGNGKPIGADGQPIPDGERFGSISDPDAQRAMAQGGRIVPQQGSAFEGSAPEGSPASGAEPPPPYVTAPAAAPTAPAGPPAAAPGGGTTPEGKTTMTDTKIVSGGTAKAGRQPGSRIRPASRAQHTAARAGGAMPAEWGGVIARAADFEPDDDGELLGWMGDEVSGVAGYAEALVDLYESCTAGIGLDPVAMTALHDVADAAAHAAETMSGARHRFADHYELPREFAANGGLMTHDGRWVTGDGDA